VGWAEKTDCCTTELNSYCWSLVHQRNLGWRGGLFWGEDAAHFHVRMLKSDFNLSFAHTLCWQLCHLGSAGLLTRSLEAGRGGNPQRSRPSAPGWVGVEKGLSLPATLVFSFCLSPSPRCCEQFQTQTEQTLWSSATFYIVTDHQAQPCVPLVAALKHTHTDTCMVQNGPFNPSVPAEERQSSRACVNAWRSLPFRCYR